MAILTDSKAEPLTIITVKIRPETARKIDNFVKAQPSLLNKSQLVRSAVEEFLDKHACSTLATVPG